MVMRDGYGYSVCRNGHANPFGASFCNTCGNAMTPSSPPAAAAPVAAVAAGPVSKRRTFLPLVVAIVAVLAIVGGGGYFVWTSVQQGQLVAAANERKQAWNSAVSAASSQPFVTVDSEDAITFRSARKKYCDPNDFMHYDGGWGETVNWDAVETCKLRAMIRTCGWSSAGWRVVGAPSRG
jgi:nitrate reductase NapE component